MFFLFHFRIQIHAMQEHRSIQRRYIVKVSTYAQKLAKEEIKQNRFYIGVLSFAIFIMIIFMHMVMHGPVKPSSVDFMVLMTSSFPYLLAGITSVLAILMVYYANELYLLSHQKELGLISVCGGNVGAVAKFVFAQNIVFMIYALPLALLTSFIALPILQALSKLFLESSAQIFSYQLQAYGCTLFLVCIMFIALLMGNTGFIYRHELKQLLGFYKAQTEFIVDYPFKKLVAVFICILPLLGICFLPAGITVDFGMLVVAVFTIQGMLRNVVIDILRRCQRKHYLHEEKTIVYAHVSEMLNNNLGPIKLVNAAIMIGPMLLLFYQDDINMFVLVFTFFITTLGMSAVCLQHRLSETALQQKDDMQCLLNLGYDEMSIRKIIRSEVHRYYAIVFILPIIYIAIAFIKSFIYKLVSAQMLSIIVISMLIFIILNILLSKSLFQHYTELDKGERSYE